MHAYTKSMYLFMMCKHYKYCITLSFLCQLYFLCQFDCWGLRMKFREHCFHRFPKTYVSRTGSVVTQHTKVCSMQHILKSTLTAKGTQFLTASAIPMLFEWNNYANSNVRCNTGPCFVQDVPCCCPRAAGKTFSKTPVILSARETVHRG